MKNDMNLNTNKKYVMILTDDIKDRKVLIDIVFANTSNKLIENFTSRTIFQDTYNSETGELISSGIALDTKLKNDIEKFEQKNNLNMIKKIRQSKEKVEFDGIDEDTILVDAIEACDFEMAGIAEDIFNIYEKSTDKKSLEQLFFEFTDMEFSDYLEKCIKRIDKDD